MRPIGDSPRRSAESMGSRCPFGPVGGSEWLPGDVDSALFPDAARRGVTCRIRSAARVRLAGEFGPRSGRARGKPGRRRDEFVLASMNCACMPIRPAKRSCGRIVPARDVPGDRSTRNGAGVLDPRLPRVAPRFEIAARLGARRIAARAEVSAGESGTIDQVRRVGRFAETGHRTIRGGPNHGMCGLLHSE